MEDPQIPINRAIIVIEAPTAARGIARAQDRRDEGESFFKYNGTYNNKRVLRFLGYLWM